MGVVFKARHAKLNRVVALKMIQAGGHAVLNDTIRFLAEAEAVAVIKHPHVVQLFDYGEHQGRPYMALEFCDGGSFAQRLQKGAPLSPFEAAVFLEKIASGVAAAHNLGIIHRDLKPANVLLDSGEPKVSDFGLAKRGGGADLTHTGAIMGTPHYMAPEQAGGGTKYVGPPADVWSLGVILFQTLTGKRPFHADSTEGILSRVLLDEPAPLRSLVAGLPRDLDLICRKCLEKNAADRYPTAQELSADLARFTRGEPISVRPAGLLERGYKWARRKPAIASLYAAAVLGAVLIAATTGFATLWGEARSARDTAETARGQVEGLLGIETKLRGELQTTNAKLKISFQNEESARKEVERERKKLALFHYGRTIEMAHQDWRENNITEALALLHRTRPELRGWEWQYVHRLCQGQLVTLKGHKKAVSSAAFSPDDTRIVTASHDGTVRVWDARSGAVVATLTGHCKDVNTAAFSRTARGSSPRQWTARRGCGTPEAGPRSPLSRGTKGK